MFKNVAIIIFTGIVSIFANATIQPFGSKSFALNNQTNPTENISNNYKKIVKNEPFDGYEDFLENNSSNDLNQESSDYENPSSQAAEQELREFYTNEEFPYNLTAELHAKVSFAAGDLTQIDMKNIFNVDKCDRLIDQIAQVVHQEVTERMIQGSKDIRYACPDWIHLDRESRKNFYVALVTSLALIESSCDNHNDNRRASNGTAYGLWQSKSRLTPIKGARWAINQIDSQMEQSNLLFWSNSNRNYWAALNPNIHAHKVKSILKKIPACAIRALKK